VSPTTRVRARLVASLLSSWIATRRSPRRGGDGTCRTNPPPPASGWSLAPNTALQSSKATSPTQSALSAEDAANRRIDRDVPNTLSANRSHEPTETRNSRGDRTHTPGPFPATARSRSNEPKTPQPARPPRTAHPLPSTTPDRRRAAKPAEPATAPPSVLASEEVLMATLTTRADNNSRAVNRPVADDRRVRWVRRIVKPTAAYGSGSPRAVWS